MKTKLLFVFTILFLKFGFTQDYYPLVEEDKTWYVVETGFPDFIQSTIYKCEGDTLIETGIYKALFISWVETEEYWSKIGYIREDENQKVYFSFYNSNEPSNFEPKLLYDFNASINDSLTIYPFFFYNEQTEMDIVITDIDSVLVDGDFRKRTWFDCGYSEHYWIEGIGSNTGLLQIGFYCTVACPTCDLQCVKKDGTMIYPDGYTGSCWVVGIDETNEDKTSFNIFPNPTTNNFMVEPLSQIHSELFFQIYNSMGKLEIQEILNNNQATQILTGDLENSIYFYIISDENGVVQKGKVLIL